MLGEIPNTSIEPSILGQPITFTDGGDLEDAKFFVFRVKDKDFELIEQ